MKESAPDVGPGRKESATEPEVFFVPINLPAGRVLGDSVAMFFTHFLSFTGISVLVFSPMVVWLVIVMNGFSLGDYSSLGRINHFTLALTASTFLLQPIAGGAIIYAVFRAQKGQPASFGKCLAVGISRIFHLLGVALMVNLGITVVFAAITASASALTYYHLKTGAEGADKDQLASMFD